MILLGMSGADIGEPFTGKGFSLRLSTRIEPSYFGGEGSLPSVSKVSCSSVMSNWIEI